jgi:hypothetical protein
MFYYSCLCLTNNPEAVVRTGWACRVEHGCTRLIDDFLDLEACLRSSIRGWLASLQVNGQTVYYMRDCDDRIWLHIRRDYYLHFIMGAPFDGWVGGYLRTPWVNVDTSPKVRCVSRNDSRVLHNSDSDNLQ